MQTQKKFTIVVPSYNNSRWYKKNLDSVLNQDYDNYNVIYIDDCSGDDTANLVEKYISNHIRKNIIKLIKNNKREGALANIYNAVLALSDETIVVLCDGDDWLYDNHVLKKLNNIYSTNPIWITYGSFITPNGKIYGEAIPEEIIEKNLIRNYRWVTSHLKTFYVGLFKKIEKQDLLFYGDFFATASDIAFMIPMLEMARDRSCFIEEVLYFYNNYNPINDHKINRSMQLLQAEFIRFKPKYAKITSL